MPRWGVEAPRKGSRELWSLSGTMCAATDKKPELEPIAPSSWVQSALSLPLEMDHSAGTNMFDIGWRTLLSMRTCPSIQPYGNESAGISMLKPGPLHYCAANVVDSCDVYL
jgi:hypothetical protein